MLELRGQWRREYERTLKLLGTPATINRKDGGSVECLVGLNSKPSDELVNAYGINVKVVTVLISDVPDLEKFDRITLDGERHTIDDIRVNRINDINVSHICIVRGK